MECAIISKLLYLWLLDTAVVPNLEFIWCRGFLNWNRIIGLLFGAVCNHHPLSYFYFCSVYVCMILQKQASLWEGARFQSCFSKGTADFLWVESLLSSILLFCFTSQAALLWLQTLSLQLLMLSWQALSKDFQVSLQSLCWLLGAPRRMQILESSTLAKCPANHNCNLTEISVLGFCSCSEVSRHHGKWFLLSESAGSCFGWHRSQAFQVFPLLLRRTTFRAGPPEMEKQQQVEVGGCVICLQFAICQGRWSSRKTYGDGRMGERWDLQRWWLDQQPFLHKGCTVEKSHQLFSLTLIKSIMWCCIDPNPIQVVLWFTGCWIPVTAVQSWQQLQKDRSSSSLSPAPPNPAFFWCTLVCWSTPQQP